MRDMNEDERKVYSEKMDYIAKLKDSMDQSEMDGLLPKEIQAKMDTPRFTFGGEYLYPRKDFNDYLEASFTGSPMAERLSGLERTNAELEAQVSHLKAEGNQYVEEIERLEKEVKDLKAKSYRDDDDQHTIDVHPMPLKAPLFFQGEMESFTYQLVGEWMRNHRPQTPSEGVRAYELAKVYRDSLDEFLDHSDLERRSTEFRQKLEKAIDEVHSTSPTDISPLVALGFVNCTRKNSPHWKIRWKNRDEYTFVIAKTPSDKCSLENCKRNIVSRLCV